MSFIQLNWGLNELELLIGQNLTLQFFWNVQMGLFKNGIPYLGT